MGQERLKGLIVILILGVLTFGLVKFLASRQGEDAQAGFNFSPRGLKKRFWGVINQARRRAKGESIEGETIEPAEIIEQKAGELLDEIKKLPQEQAEIVKEKILKQMCEEIIEKRE